MIQVDNFRKLLRLKEADIIRIDFSSGYSIFKIKHIDKREEVLFLEFLLSSIENWSTGQNYYYVINSKHLILNDQEDLFSVEEVEDIFILDENSQYEVLEKLTDTEEFMVKFCNIKISHEMKGRVLRVIGGCQGEYLKEYDLFLIHNPEAIIYKYIKD